MASRICLVAPYKELAEVARSFADTCACAFDVETANLEDAVTRLPELEARGYRVLISRGRTADLLRRNTALPVIDIKINSYDVLHALGDLLTAPRAGRLRGPCECDARLQEDLRSSQHPVVRHHVRR